MGRCCPLWPSLATLPENNEGESNGEEGETEEINLHNARNRRAVSATGSAARTGSQSRAGVARRLGFSREAWRGRDVGLGRQPACIGRVARRMLLGRPHGHAGRAAREGRLVARGGAGRLQGTSQGPARGGLGRAAGRSREREQRDEGDERREREKTEEPQWAAAAGKIPGARARSA
jgi:hypothetical protein